MTQEPPRCSICGYGEANDLVLAVDCGHEVCVVHRTLDGGAMKCDRCWGHYPALDGVPTRRRVSVDDHPSLTAEERTPVDGLNTESE